MTDTAPTRVLLVDDQELFRAGVAVIIDAQPDMEVVGQAPDGTGGWRWPKICCLTWC